MHKPLLDRRLGFVHHFLIFPPFDGNNVSEDTVLDSFFSFLISHFPPVCEHIPPQSGGFPEDGLGVLLAELQLSEHLGGDRLTAFSLLEFFLLAVWPLFFDRFKRPEPVLAVDLPDFFAEVSQQDFLCRGQLIF